MNFQSKYSRFMRNSGPARTLVPVGLILIIFGGIMIWMKQQTLLAVGLIVIGILAIVFGIMRSAKAFAKSKELDADRPGKSLPPVDFTDFKNAEGVSELYSRHDGVTLKPGYILEDADRTVLYEAKMTKQALVGSRVFTFIDHASGLSQDHEVGHTTQQHYNDEFFSARGWFKFDGENIWDVLHERGLRMATDIIGTFPNVSYQIVKDGKPFAIVETSGKYVHEDEAAEHSINIPVGKFYYRIWTNSRDIETIFLAVFAFSESEQIMTE